MKINQFIATNEVMSGTRGGGGSLPRSSGTPKLDPNSLRDLGIDDIGRQLVEIGKKQEELERKRQDAADQTEALNLYTSFAKEADETLGDMKLGADANTAHRTFSADYDKKVRSLIEKVGAKASRPEVRDLFVKKALPFYLERGFEARRYQDKLTVDFHEAGLTGYLAELRRQIAKSQDENSAIVLLNQGLAEIDRYANVIGKDKSTTKREEFRTLIGNMLAEQALNRNPELFQQSYQRYQDIAKPEFLANLLERAPKLIEHAENRRRQRADWFRQEQDRILKQEAESWVNSIEERLLDPALPTEDRPSLQEINLGLAKFSTVVDRSTRDALRKLATDPLVHGGVDRPGAKEEVENAILMRASETTEAHIMRRTDLSLGTKNALIKELRQRRKTDDISNDHYYKLGEKTIYLQLGGVTPEQAALGFLGMGQFAKPEAQANLARALRLFDRRARMGGVKREDLPAIADQIISSIMKATPKDTQSPGTQSPQPGQPQAAPKDEGEGPSLPPREKKSEKKSEGTGWLNFRRKK